jgi:hypothetical protein
MQFARNRWLILGLGFIILGYALLAAARSTTLAPLLLVGGYCIFLPLHLWVRHRSDGTGE